MNIKRFFFRGVDEFGSQIWEENKDGDWCHAADIELLTAERDALDKGLSALCRDVSTFTFRAIKAERELRRSQKEQKTTLDRFVLLVARPDGDKPENLEEVADILLCRVRKIEAERDAAVAAKERAKEAIIDLLDGESVHDIRANTGLSEKRCAEIMEVRNAILAAAPDKPQYAALAPEPWGGPEE